MASGCFACVFARGQSLERMLLLLINLDLKDILFMFYILIITN